MLVYLYLLLLLALGDRRTLKQARAGGHSKYGTPAVDGKIVASEDAEALMPGEYRLTDAMQNVPICVCSAAINRVVMTNQRVIVSHVFDWCCGLFGRSVSQSMFLYRCAPLLPLFMLKPKPRPAQLPALGAARSCWKCALVTEAGHVHQLTVRDVCAGMWWMCPSAPARTASPSGERSAP